MYATRMPKTQAEVDKLITSLIASAVHYEELRDAEEYESEMYWHYHDVAIRWHQAAESWMPKSARTIK